MRGHIVKRYKNSYTIVLNVGRDPTTGRPKQQWISKAPRKRLRKGSQSFSTSLTPARL